jgi:CDP-diglyceride synthetase
MVDSYAAIVENILIIIKNLTWLGSALALFYFIYGIVKYVASGDNATKRSESVKTITYGLIALFVLIAVWSLVGLLQESLVGGRNLNIPQFNASN